MPFARRTMAKSSWTNPANSREKSVSGTIRIPSSSCKDWLIWRSVTTYAIRRFGKASSAIRHRAIAHAMVITIWLHMYRVFLTGSYKPPREFNWGVGVILLVLTLLLSFTGYLLPWDQLAIWAITVGSNMARATPFMGYEGPGAKILTIGGVELIHSGSDARFLLLGGRFVGGTTLLGFYVS